MPSEANNELAIGQDATEAGLASHQQRLQLSKLIAADIDSYCEEAYNDGHRTHLGASQIGHPCSRYLWYMFRWVKEQRNPGRSARLLNRGKREEDRFIEWLRGIGAEVWEHDTNGTQFRVKAVNGHFGGSLDCVIKLPARYNIEQPLLGEFKTNGTGKGFSDLLSKGVVLAKGQHFAQMSVYGKAYNLPYAGYFNICKNDDNLHVEVVELDFKLAAMLEYKAEEIIRSQTAPAEYALSDAVFECKYCFFQDICRGREQPEKNCRSCSKCEPVEDGQWYCHEYNNIIPKEYISKGCDEWMTITQS